MLSPREFAVLMLANDSADRIASREELEPHLERQVVLLEQLGPTSNAEDALFDGLVRFH